MSQHTVTRALRRIVDQLHGKTTGDSRPTCRPQLMPLEDRTMPATASGSISGVAFIDRNSNGIREATETLIPGAVMTLTGTTTTGKAVSARVGTSSSGGYAFTNVLPGTYKVFAGAVPGFSPFLVNGVSLGPVGGNKLVLNQALAGGQHLVARVSYTGLGNNFVSVNQLLSSSNSNSFPFNPPGAGTVQVNVRPNNRPTVSTAIGNVTVNQNAADRFIDLAGNFTDKDISNSRVRIVTSEGNINIELYDKDAPLTVANFLNYVRSNHYDNSVFHRLATNFVLQGGGYKFSANPSRIDELTNDPAVANEFSATRPNVSGTIAMAKLGGDPNSATDQFFFNLTDNTSTLGPTNNGGFTVFGKLIDDRAFVSGSDRFVLNRLTSYTVRNFSTFNSAFDTFPVKNFSGSNFPTGTTAANYALIKDVQITRQTERLTYSVVSNSNSGLVATSIKDNRLKLDFVNGQSGNAQITVRATDRYGASTTSTFTVTVNNQAPTVGVSFPAAAINTGSSLVATATATDPNGDPVKLTYKWKVGDTVVKTTSNTSALTDTLDLSQVGNGNRGDVITVEVVGNDGSLNSTTATATKTVSDSLATINSLVLSPTNPTTSQLLTVTTTASDLDGDAITFTYVWKVGGSTVKTTADTTSLTDTLDLDLAGNGDVGDQISVEVTPRSNSANGNMVSTSTTVV
ncbi:MAG: peptidylprolyl isomerase [Gemmataceae bacterium]